MTTPRALFVDDEPYVLKALRRIFSEDDLDVQFAANGQEALNYLKENPVDLILSDHNMPGMNGVEFLKHSREIQPNCIRMLITGKGDMEIALQAINQGQIYNFFNKPWEDEELRISVLHALEFKQAQERMKLQEEKLARFEAYRQTMVTVSHYINNFNCGLIMSIEGLRNSPNLSEEERRLIALSLKAAEKISEVLRILNQVQDLKTADYPFTAGMIDIEKEMEAAVKRIEEG